MPAPVQRSASGPLRGLVASLAAVLAATIVAAALQRFFGVERVSGVYFVAVVICASAYGLWDGILAAALATFAYDFVSEGAVFVLTLGDKQDIVNFTLFGAGAWVV